MGTILVITILVGLFWVAEVLNSIRNQ